MRKTSEDNQFVEILANQMSKETHFSSESKKMYYFVREAAKETQQNEGFASTVKLGSEMSDGQLCIDGQVKFDLAYGDIVQIDNKPEYNLKCIKFIV